MIITYNYILLQVIYFNKNECENNKNFKSIWNEAVVNIDYSYFWKNINVDFINNKDIKEIIINKKSN